MKNIYIVILFLLPFFATAQIQHVVLKAHIANYSGKGKAHLSFNDKIDSCDLSDGGFSFKENIAQPLVALLSIVYDGPGRHINYAYIYLLNGAFQINLSSPLSSFSITISGPKLAKEYQEQLRGPVDYFNRKINSIGTKYVIARSKVPGDSVLITKLKHDLDDTVKLCFAIPQRYIKINPDSPLSLIALDFLGNGKELGSPINTDTLSQLYNSLSERLKNTRDGIEYLAKLNSFRSELK